MSVKCRTCGKVYRGGEKFCSVDGTPLEEPAERPKRSATLRLPSEDVDLDVVYDALVGRVINNRYRITEKLGEGGTSVVYLALRESINEPVAIKFLKDELAKRVGSVERFIVEARASSRVDHPNIVSVFDFGRTGDRYYLVMEYVSGRSLIRCIKDSRGFAQERVVVILQQLLEAVSAAHAKNIIHRDLKPENVILTTERGNVDYIKVLDFGLAKFTGSVEEAKRLTRHGVILGTPYYMSPEQARCEKVDYRTDLYSIGVMAYEMLTGFVPFRGGSPVEVLNRHILKKPKPPSIARPDVKILPELEQLILKLLSKSPERRFQSAEETLLVLAEIEQSLKRAPVEQDEVMKRARNIGERGQVERRRASTPPPPRPTATTIWEAPGLLEDSSRLVRLWDERISEVSNMIWGRERWPQEVIASTESIRALEREIEKKERKITPIREEIEGVERRAREQEAMLRFERLDLVARQCVVQEVMGGGVELSNIQELATRATLLGMNDLIATGTTDHETIQSLHDELDRLINEIDSKARRLRRKTKRAIATRQRLVHNLVNEIRELRRQQVPKCNELLARINQETRGRTDLASAVTAVAEVAGALQIFQSLLGALKSPEETPTQV